MKWPWVVAAVVVVLGGLFCASLAQQVVDADIVHFPQSPERCISFDEDGTGGSTQVFVDHDCDNTLDGADFYLLAADGPTGTTGDLQYSSGSGTHDSEPALTYSELGNILTVEELLVGTATSPPYPAESWLKAKQNLLDMRFESVGPNWDANSPYPGSMSQDGKAIISWDADAASGGGETIIGNAGDDDDTLAIFGGFNATCGSLGCVYTGPTIFYTNAAFTAFAGGGQGSATSLACNTCNVDTVASEGDSVKFATMLGGTWAHVYNSGANTMALFPRSGGNLGAGLNASIDVPSDHVALCDFTINNLGFCTVNAHDQAAAYQTQCVWIEDPTAADDFESIWTANGFGAEITKMWCESDQTVNMDLQIDDGTPADVAGTDLVCDSTPAEDESGLDGTMADGDRLDTIITSVSGTPTWVAMCWTYYKLPA